MKNIFKNIDLNVRRHWREHIMSLSYYAFVFVYLEMALHLSMYKSIDSRIVYPVLFALISGSILWLVSSLFPRKANKVTGILVISLVTIYFEVQLIYHCVFGSFMPLSQIFLGGGAITNYYEQIWYEVTQNIPSVLLLMIPIPLTVFIFCKNRIKTHRLKLLQIPFGIMIIGALIGSTLAALHITNTSSTSAYALLVNPYASTEASIRQLGLAATTVQEFKGMVYTYEDRTVFLATSLNDYTAYDTEMNMLNIDFVNLTATASDETHKLIDKYASTVAPSNKNDYTGVAAGYNVITVCAEAFSPYLIDPELTPTLYKLSTEGLVFDNFYNSFPNTTTNGEYSFCMGLMPNMSRDKLQNSFHASADNYLPFCLGTIAKDNGYKTFAYHNYYANFYDRNITHTNMGYDFKAIAGGLNMEPGNPSSDHTMIKVSTADYLSLEEPFHAYYMTYSGHYQYNWDNDMSAKNKDKVAHLPYSDGVKAYIACNLELEYAMAELMQRLEAAGKADTTMIVLTTDHYPYGLSEEQYNELAGEKVDPDFEKYRNSFICYIPGIEPVEVDEYCCTIDILPTLLNLLGFNFDSRLLAGRDIMSDAPHIAVLADGKFITEEFKYDPVIGKAIDHLGKEVNMEKAVEYVNYVNNMFTISRAILESDYYAHVFSKTAASNGIVRYDFKDIKDLHVQNAASYMMSNGYMEPVSDTYFGVDRKPTLDEFLQVLYRIEGEPQVYSANLPPYKAWAQQQGFVGVNDDLSVEPTHATAARILYKYTAARADIEPKSEEYINSLCNKYPYINRNTLIALDWCVERSVFATPVTKTDFEKIYDQPFNKGQMAVFLQRTHSIILAKDADNQ